MRPTIKAAAREHYRGDLAVARPDLVINLKWTDGDRTETDVTHRRVRAGNLGPGCTAHDLFTHAVGSGLEQFTRGTLEASGNAAGPAGWLPG